MIFKLVEKKKVQTFAGFRQFTGKAAGMIAALYQGEWDYWDWDGTDMGLEELLRLYRFMYNGDEPKRVKKYMKLEI